LLAGTPAEAVAHHGEPVEREVEHGDAVLRVRTPEHAFQVGAEELPVRQARRHVVQCLPVQFSLQQHEFRAVLGDQEEVARRVVGPAQQGRGQRDPRDVAVRPAQPLQLAEPVHRAFEHAGHPVSQQLHGIRVHEVEDTGAGQLRRRRAEHLGERGVGPFETPVEVDDHDPARRGGGDLVEARLALLEVPVGVADRLEQGQVHAFLLAQHGALTPGEEAARQCAQHGHDRLGEPFDRAELGQCQQSLAEHVQGAA
jgi:hypothetical protein